MMYGILRSMIMYVLGKLTSLSLSARCFVTPAVFGTGTTFPTVEISSMGKPAPRGCDTHDTVVPVSLTRVTKSYLLALGTTQISSLFHQALN